jgi:uncharacterized protein involved in response to NO
MPSMSTTLAPPQPRWTPFAYGFRPFFLLAIWYAMLVIPAWLWLLQIGFSPVNPLPAFVWHGHEMLFGFVAAAIAGFLLTAVPSWTGIRGFAGLPLYVLAALWLLGRVAFALAGVLPMTVVALADLAFLPALAACLARPLLRERNRNTRLLLVLAAFWLADASVVAGIATANPDIARRGLLAGLDIVLLLVTVIAGRIVPAFTASGLRSRAVTVTIRSFPLVERGVIAIMAVNVLVDAMDLRGRLSPMLTAAVAVAAALLHAVRMARWQELDSLGQPIVWILHAAYSWLVIGFFLKALALGLDVAWAGYWLHALGVGAAATMIVAVMTRAALGHTGRPLIASRSAVAGYGLLLAAAAARVFAPAVFPGAYYATIVAAAALWSMAFALLAIAYTPILLHSRADGRPG